MPRLISSFSYQAIRLHILLATIMRISLKKAFSSSHFVINFIFALKIVVEKKCFTDELVNFESY